LPAETQTVIAWFGVRFSYWVSYDQPGLHSAQATLPKVASASGDDGCPSGGSIEGVTQVRDNFDISPRVTYNRVLDASVAGSKPTPLIADLTPDATAMKEYLGST